jgi:hypothetical protein
MVRRLYLDVADLFDVGDGRVLPAHVEELVAALGAADVVLVVSRDHIHDADRGGPPSVESLVRAVEMFPRVVAVTDGPEVVEPLTAERRDIVVEPCSNFRELAFADAARAPVASLAALYDRLHVGDQAAQRELVSAPRVQGIWSRKAGELFSQCYVTLSLGSIADPQEVLSLWEGKLLIDVTADEREAILTKLRAVRRMLDELLPLAKENGVDVAESLRRWATWNDRPDEYPGHHLALCIGAARRRNVGRKPQVSDWLDSDHAKHFPYVDFATCDANTLDVARRVLPTMTGPRQPIVLNNRRLDQVVAALRSEGAEPR